jgi:hypothetical protein
MNKTNKKIDAFGRSACKVPHEAKATAYIFWFLRRK